MSGGASLSECAMSPQRLYVCVRNYIIDGGRSSAINLQGWVANRSMLLCSRGKVVSDTLKGGFNRRVCAPLCEAIGVKAPGLLNTT